MRSVNCLIFSLGLGVFLSTGWAGAQDAKPAVQVVIGPDGCVKVIDPKTGKEVPSVVTRVQPKPSAEPKTLQVELGNLDLEKILQAQLLQKKDGKGDLPFEIELQLVPGPGGNPRIITLQPAAGKPATVDQKLDMLLKQMGELRRDVNQLKARLDGKKGDEPRGGFRGWEWKFDMKPGGFEPKQLDKETLERLKELFKKMGDESPGKRKKGDNQKNEQRGPDNRNEQLEQRLERILQEAEALRKEIQKSKSGSKK